MAIPTVKSTYVLDLESAAALERLAREWNVSKSEVLRRAIKSAAGAPVPNRVELLRMMQKAAALTSTSAVLWARRVRAERKAVVPGARGGRR